MYNMRHQVRKRKMSMVKERTANHKRAHMHHGFPMPRLAEDVISFSECRNNLAACLKRTGETHRLIFITQNGRPTSFIGNIEDWDAFVETQELMADVRAAEAELDRGEYMTHAELKRQVDDEGERMRMELGL